MSKLTNLNLLNKRKPIEVVLELVSFAGGEHTKSPDHVLKPYELEELTNWEITTIGGIEREKGINQVASGGASYSNQLDLLIQHEDSGGDGVYGVCEGDLVIKSGTSIAQEDAAAFTSGVLCHAVSLGGGLWITNSTDNLHRKTVGVAIAAPASQPATACARIFGHKSRLVAEGSGTLPKRIYGSRAGSGNWTAADGWSLANDAWNIDLPEDTEGCAPGFPSGDQILAFTKHEAFVLSGFPNVRYDPIKPSVGCGNGYSIATGNEGVFFYSNFPTKGIYLFNGVSFINLTEDCEFIDDIDDTKRMYGFYKDRKYFFIYNESGSGVTYPNRMKIYDTRYGAWRTKTVNASVGHSLGYPALLKYSNNEMYIAASDSDFLYEYAATDDDEGCDVDALLKTKDFSSADFAFADGGQFPIDNVILKLTKISVTYYGTTGSFAIYWTGDRGKRSGYRTFTLTADGDLINSTFIVNTSKVVTDPPEKTITKSVRNDAVGELFQFEIRHSGQSTRPKIKKIKIHAILWNES